MDQHNKSKDVYTGIDIFKLIAAMLVVLLHTVETSDFYACEIKFVATRFAVPFFFITSGFFFYKGLEKAQDKKSYFLRYEKHLIKIFIIWGIIIYSPFIISGYVTNNPDSGIIKIMLLLFRRIFVIGPGPYWYLMALIWSIAFLYLCYVKKSDKLLFFCVIIGLLLEVSYSCFRGILSNIVVFRYIFKFIYVVFSWEFNYIMFGIPFAGIGYLICKKNIRIPFKLSLYVFVFATVLRVIEYNLPVFIPNEIFWNENEISIVFIIQAIAFFLMAKEWNPELSGKQSLTIRQLSSFIYFAHVIILYNIFNEIIGRMTTWPIYSSAFILPKWLLVLVICTGCFAIIKKVNNKHFNILING